MDNFFESFVKYPAELLMFMTPEEIRVLEKFRGTELFDPYVKKLKEKYSKLLYFLDDGE